MAEASNPFTQEKTGALPFRFPQGQTWETLMAKLAGQHFVGAVVGGPGSGKTLLLEQMTPHLEALGFEPALFRLTNETSLRDKERLADAMRAVVRPGFILLDGGEQLSTRLWLPIRAAASGAAGFVVTVHRSSRLPTLVECEATPALLQELVQELAGEPILPDDAEALLLRHRGSIRAALRDLEQWWDQQSAAAEGE